MDLFHRCVGVARRRHRNYKAIVVIYNSKAAIRQKFT